MTQPPIPYSLPQIPPSGYWLGPADALLAPARRASWLMIALGALALCCGVCLIGVRFIPVNQLVREGAIDPAMLDQLGITAEQFLKIVVVVMCGLLAAGGLAFIAVGSLIRNGKLPWIILALILAAGTSLLMLLQFLSGAFMLLGKGNPNGLLPLALFGVLLAVMGLLFYWLIQAVRATVPLKQMMLQQQQQWYAMQQQYFSSQR